MMGNRIDIGSNNKIKGSNISGNDTTIIKEDKKRTFISWFLKHLGTIITAIISGAVSAFVAWLITYLCLK